MFKVTGWGVHLQESRSDFTDYFKLPFNSGFGKKNGYKSWKM
jgi:hypothetical protein